MFKSRKISEDLKMCEPKPPIISQQCVVYNYKCDLCDAEYVGYTSRYLHQRIDEHRYSAIGKHLKNDHGLETIGDHTNNFSVLKKCNGKLDCLIYETDVMHKQEKAMLEHTTRLPTHKTIYLNLSLVTCIFYFLSPCTVYIMLSILFSFT